MIENNSFLDKSQMIKEPIEVSADKSKLLNPQGDKLMAKPEEEGYKAVFAPLNNVAKAWNLLLNGINADSKAEFRELREILVDNAALLENMKNGEILFDAGGYERFLRVYQALSVCINLNSSAGDEASARLYRIANILRRQFDYVSEPQLGENFENIIGDVEYSPKEKNFATENVQRLFKYYVKYSAAVDSNLIATDEEKLVKKWNVLKACERDIRVYLNSKKKESERKNTELNKEDAYLLSEYQSLKTQMMYRQMLYGKDKKTASNKEAGLKKEQLSAISTIDTWIVRNFRNGGYMAFTGAYTERTDIVAKLLSMPLRKRLYIYYLVESRERINPTTEGFLTSQVTYVPSLKKFKGRMIARRWMFYKRFSGGYIYWNKLSQAMGLAKHAEPLIDKAETLLVEERAKEKGDISNQNINEIAKSKVKSNSDENLRKILYDAIFIMNLDKENKSGRISKEKKKENEEEIVKRCHSIAHLLKKCKNEGTSMLPSYKDYTHKAPKDLSAILQTVMYSSKDTHIQGWLDLSPKEVGDFSKYFDKITNGISAIAALAGSVFEFLSLKDDGKAMPWLDVVSKSTNFLHGVYKAGRSGISIAQSAGASGSVLKAITSSTSFYATSGIDTAVTVMNTASYFKARHHRKKATSLVRSMVKNNGKKSEEDRFREGILKLNKRLEKRQKKSTIGSISMASISTTASVLVTAAVLTPLVSAVAGAIAFGIGIGMTITDAASVKSMKNALFDSFYKVDEAIESEITKWQQRNKGKTFPKSLKHLLKEQIRYKIAADEGFYSPRHAAKAVASRYAEFILDNAHKGTPESKTYIEIIKGLGLKYKYIITDDKGSIPKASDIVKKLCG